MASSKFFNKLKKPPPTNQSLSYPLFSDLEGFEEEIEFLRRNVLLPYINKDIYKKSGILELPQGVIFHGNQSGLRMLILALNNELNLAKFGDPVPTLVFKKMPKIVLWIISSTRSSNEVVKAFDKIGKEMDGSGSKIFIVWVDDISNVPSSALTYDRFRLTFQCPKVLSHRKKRSLLLSYTRIWEEEAQPEPQLLIKVAGKCGLNEMDDLRILCRNVYDKWMLDRLEGKMRQTSEEDWDLELEKMKLGKSKMGLEKVKAVSQNIFERFDDEEIGKDWLNLEIAGKIKEPISEKDENASESNYLKLAGCSTKRDLEVVKVKPVELDATIALLELEDFCPVLGFPLVEEVNEKNLEKPKSKDHKRPSLKTNSKQKQSKEVSE